jgi:hypothetical protein
VPVPVKSLWHFVLRENRGRRSHPAARGSVAERARIPRREAREWLRVPRFNPLDMTTRNRSVLAFNLSFLLGRTALLQAAVNALVGWVEAGAIQVPKVCCFRLASNRSDMARQQPSSSATCHSFDSRKLIAESSDLRSGDPSSTDPSVVNGA